MSNNFPLPHHLKWVILGLAAATVALAALALLGWALNLLILASFHPVFKPMAPSAALALLLLSGALFVSTVRPGSVAGRLFASAAAALIILIGMLAPAQAVWNFDLGLDRLLAGRTLISGGMRQEAMSPIAAGLLLMLSLALLAPDLFSGSQRAWRASAWLAAGAALLASGFAIDYLYGSPFFYGSAILPPALPLVLAILLLGIGMFLASAPHLPGLMDFLFGASLRNRLLRIYLPLILASVFLNHLLIHQILSLWNSLSLSLDLAWDTFLSLVTTGALVYLITQEAVRPLERADAALKRESQLNAAQAELGQALISAQPSLDAIVKITLDYARRLTGSEHGFVSYIDPANGDNIGYTLTEMMSDCRITDEKERRIVFPKGADGRYPSLWGHALNSGEAFYTNQPSAHPAARGVPAGHIPLHNFLAAPALFAGKPVGLIALSNAPQGYTNWELLVAQKLALLYAVAVQRQQDVEILQESESRFRSLFNTMTEGMALHEVVYDEAGQAVDYLIRQVNPSYTLHTGLDASSVEGKKASEVYGAGAPPYLDIYARVAAGGPAQRFEVYFLPLQRHFDISVISPAPGKFATVFQDITERKQAEEATQRRAAHLALLNDIGLKVSATLAVEEVLDRAALLLQKYFNYHHVGIFLLDAERSAMVMRARAGQYSHLFPPQHAVPLTQGIVGWVGTHGNRLVVNDVTADPHYQNFYPESIPTRAEMCIPIQSKEKIIGALDIQSSQVNAFGEEDILVVEILAGQIAAALENSHLYTQTQINLKERETLLKEVHHRVKNNLQIIISLLSLRSESIQDEHALQVFQDCQNSVRSISFIHEKLYQSTNLARISAESYFHDLIQHLKMVFSGQAVAINILVSIEPVMLDIETAIPCGLIITELITNAIKHAFPASYPENAPRSLHIELQSVGDRLKLLVSDNGVGLPPNFTLEHHHSLGLQLVSLLVKQLRGSLSISGEGGAAFCIEFPRPPAA